MIYRIFYWIPMVLVPGTETQSSRLLLGQSLLDRLILNVILNHANLLHALSLRDQLTVAHPEAGAFPLSNIPANFISGNRTTKWDRMSEVSTR